MKKKWILLGEDDPHDATLAKMALAEFNPSQEIVVATDGAEVLDFLYHKPGGVEGGQESPTVVLLDLKMPKVDGLEVLSRLKDDPSMRCIPVVVLTSSQREQDVKECYQLGANGYIVKPMGLDQYKQVLHDFARFWLLVNEPAPEASE